MEALRKTRCTASKLYPKPILSPEFTTKRSNTQRFPHQSQTNLELRVSSRSTRSTHARQLVFGTKSEIVRKKCITEGNNLTFAKAHEIARTEEATRLQLQAMENEPQGSHNVDSIKDHNRQGERNKYKPPFQQHDTERRPPRGEHNAIHNPRILKIFRVSLVL